MAGGTRNSENHPARDGDLARSALIGSFSWKLNIIFGGPENGSGAATDGIRSSVRSRM